jgi:hypothetical protein
MCHFRVDFLYVVTCTGEGESVADTVWSGSQSPGGSSGGLLPSRRSPGGSSVGAPPSHRSPSGLSGSLPTSCSSEISESSRVKIFRFGRGDGHSVEDKTGWSEPPTVFLSPPPNTGLTRQRVVSTKVTSE